MANVRGVQYFRWSYRVTGMSCINRGLSHWTLGLCSQTLSSVSQISQQSSDVTDMPGGTDTSYKFKVGKDPRTGLTGLKWDFTHGNAVNTVGECDDFSFIASGAETPIAWGAKGSTIVVSGTTIGPACAPVSTEARTWSAVKALFRD